MRFKKLLASIQFKMLFAFIVCLSITPILVTAFVRFRVRPELLNQRGEETLLALNDRRRDISNQLNDIFAQLRFMSSTPSVSTFLEHPTDETRADVEHIFGSFAIAEEIFDQIRILSPDGMELVRINYEDNLLEIVAPENLQDKSDRDYFLEALELNPGEIYVSEMNLNQENGVFEEPYRPVVRFIMAITDEAGTQQGFMVFNIMPVEIFNSAIDLTSDANYYISNRDGDIMFTSVDDTSILYASDLGHNIQIEALFPVTNDAHPQYIIDEAEGKLITKIAIIIDKGNYLRRWLLVYEQDLSPIVSPINRTLQSVIIIGFAGLLISIIISILITLSITRPIKKLQYAVNDLRARKWQSSIELLQSIKSMDEIGALACYFEKTLYELRQFYVQLEALVKDRTLELEWANEQLKQVDRVKSRFMEDIAHDIRTPLSSILLATAMMERNPDKLADYIQRIEHHISRIQKQMENVNTMSRLEFSFQEMEQEAINLQQIVSSLVNAYQSAFQDSGLELRTNINEVPLITGYVFMMEQLVENLLTNAIKYTNKGSIEISLYSGDEHIIFKIQDTGRGIPEAEIPLIMRRYYRVESVRQSSIPGTGIGLNIVKETVQQHDGSIKIDSLLGEGTTITIHLPVQTDSQEKHEH